ncbi:MAG TPA: hypothetical protein VES96_08560 [Nitrospiraceae bacterium]|nr:hypothetical protein [Nitrospiraceae bacterium]
MMIRLKPRPATAPGTAMAGTAVLILLCCAELLIAPPASAVNMVNDPKGFQGIPWGTALANLPNVTMVESAARIKQFDLKQSPPRLGDITVESLRLVSIDAKFARVVVRYQGMATHQSILKYLQSQFGPLDLTPGQIARGVLQQFTWSGPESDINLTYDVHRDRGFIFIENRTLVQKLDEGMAPDSDLAGATY